MTLALTITAAALTLTIALLAAIRLSNRRPSPDDQTPKPYPIGTYICTHCGEHMKIYATPKTVTVMQLDTLDAEAHLLQHTEAQ